MCSVLALTCLWVSSHKFSWLRMACFMVLMQSVRGIGMFFHSSVLMSSSKYKDGSYNLTSLMTFSSNFYQSQIAIKFLSFWIPSSPIELYILPNIIFYISFIYFSWVFIDMELCSLPLTIFLADFFLSLSDNLSLLAFGITAVLTVWCFL